MKKPVISFFSFTPPGKMPSYIQRDFETLQSVAQVRWLPSQKTPGWRRGLGPTGWWPSPPMLRAVRQSDLVFQWFATPAAPMVAARLCGKPSLLIAGGFDVTSLPEIEYGRMFEPRARAMGRLTLRLASKILSVSHFNKSEVLQWAPTTRPEVLHHGFEIERFPMGLAPRERARQIISVGAISDSYLQRKGLDNFALASRHLPDVPFVLAGKHVTPATVRHLSEMGGPNLQMPGFLSDEELNDFLRGGAVYAQLSLHEAFGCSVAEAMLSGATPVVSRNGALPEVVGDAGYYAPLDDFARVADALGRALDEPRGEQARARIIEQFPAQKRARGLVAAVRELLG